MIQDPETCLGGAWLLFLFSVGLAHEKKQYETVGNQRQVQTGPYRS